MLTLRARRGQDARPVTVRALARRLYAYAFCTDFILFYPVYALLFADTGLSTAQISSLFVIWSLTGILAQIPSGAIADASSRRLMLVLAPLFTGAGFALWTWLPSYAGFAAGFVLWGLGSSLRDGAQEALVYEELERIGAADRYARIMGRARAMLTVGAMTAVAIAAPALAQGGYQAAGIASVLACLAAAVVAAGFPEHRKQQDDVEAEPGIRETLRGGSRVVRANPLVARAIALVIVVAVLPGALDEYLPLLAADTGVDVVAVPLLILLASAGPVVGGLLAGPGARLSRRGLALVLAGSAALLVLGAAVRHPAGFAAMAIAFGGFQLVWVVAEARLQEAITGPARATVTSLAGLGLDVTMIIAYAGYGSLSGVATHAIVFVIFAAPI